ncbi:MAG: orotidine-5'-phosphate decarboxylase [Melioribacteraceae bacterium]|nr:orotidine-5'-phosphate decarboxylase [Melioribacteraceae bacterium]MCF8265055.1 orotidine-5'-phosphate decarboxylase [Melioribacteraceae bacterium]MCF8412454.1 orotidine-5'-phosphate decarboxylase [Melioribacteraceae bacterium]MCF8431912.1 orotidine-5'-phosphate decarboxylase [Melioribacteraceae bacterium]
MTAQEKLTLKTDNHKHICVGLDTDINKIPEFLLKEENPVLAFNKIIIESTKEHCGAYKINFAFYEKDGIDGLKTLIETKKLIPEDILVIADAKRGDIGNTSKMYAQAVFDKFEMDSITLHPYMGGDSVQPFLDYEDRISFILALTSNKSAEDFEKCELLNGQPLYQKVIEKIHDWNKYQNCGLVFGATNPQELISSVSLMDDLPVLLPGVGAQGGSLEEVVKIFDATGKTNYLVNVSRGLLYLDSTPAFGRAAEESIVKMNKTVNSMLLI